MKVRGLRPVDEYHPATGTLIRPETFEVSPEVAAQLVAAGLAEEVPEVLLEKALDMDAPLVPRARKEGVTRG